MSSTRQSEEPAVVAGDIRERVRERYGDLARHPGSGCGCGPSCCNGVRTGGTDPGRLGYSTEDIAAVPPESEMGLGCGNPSAIASLRPGETVVDLGSGPGLDCFIAARRVGPSGRVIGVDMTPDMLSRARASAAAHGFTNVEFRLGEIEALPVADLTADVILSNCVINLSPDKPRVFREAFRVLKPGGRLAVSDIVALKLLPEGIRRDFAAYAGCIAGAAAVEELESMLGAAGFKEVRVEVKEESRALMDEWMPGREAGKHVASANITAFRP